MRDLDPETAAALSAQYFLQAVSESLSQYLHVPTETSLTDEAFLSVNRKDVHLDRELDAVLETLVIGFRMLEKEYPSDLVVHEATVGVEV